MIMINSLSSFCHYAFEIPILIDVISHYLETTFQGQDMSDNDYPLKFNFSSEKKLTVKSKISIYMLIKKSNCDKNCTLHAGHDYLSNHLWVSLLRYRNLIVSSDTLGNFTKKERCQIQMLRTWLSSFTILYQS